jgi:CheY-like chemotaxis protein
MKESSRHLLNLINDILDISKIEAGKLELFNTDFEVDKVLNILESLAMPLGEKNNNKVIFENPGNLGFMHADETRLRQSLLNLIGNACKFTENGTVRLSVDLKKELGILEFSVIDTGIGLTDEQMTKIFENFTQAGADTTAKFGGTGLGLSITKTLVELMGGSLGVTSKLDEGSIFTITVPIDGKGKVANKEIEAELTGLNQYGPEVKDPSGSQLLIIDDDILIHDLIKRRLVNESFVIHSALDGDSGIVKAREIQPDLILLDVLMPRKDGWSVIAELKADQELNSIPIIVISTLDDDLSAKALGANSYVQKPIEKKILLENIGKIFSEGSAGKKALVIDDDPDAREIVSRLLREIGFEIDIAKNGRDGLDRLSEEHDLIILDLSMPVMDGFEFLTKIDQSSLQKIPPIIVYSAMLLDETMKIHLAKRSAGIIDKNQLSSNEGFQALIEKTLNK